MREQYGPDPFARNCLLARRLVEAGVPLITLYSIGNRDWDTHGNNFRDLKEHARCRRADRGFAALLDDLADRGLLDETLVVWMGDMGRTPKVNTGAGRDHWSFCYSVVLAGGGVRGGQVYGSSDRARGVPLDQPGQPRRTSRRRSSTAWASTRGGMTDQQGRPFVVSTGTPLSPFSGSSESATQSLRDMDDRDV